MASMPRHLFLLHVFILTTLLAASLARAETSFLRGVDAVTMDRGASTVREFGRALNDAEVNALFEAGNPYR